MALDDLSRCDDLFIARSPTPPITSQNYQKTATIMKLKHTLPGLAIAGLLMTAAEVKAAFVTYGPTLFDNGGALYSSGASGSFYFPQFDSSLGTLTSVDLTVTGNSFGGTNGLHNYSGFSGTASVSIGSNITVTGPSSLVVLTAPSQNTSGSVTALTNPGPFDFTGPDSIYIAGTSSTDTKSATLYGSFTPYEGLGNVTFNFASAVNSTSSASVSPALTESTPTQFEFEPTVTYNYITAIPEPASLGSLACLVGSGMFLRVRRRK